MAPRCLYRATAAELSVLIARRGLIRELRRSYGELVGGDLERREVESWRQHPHRR
ncbi:hypothetical protein GCM10009555_064570 [Acrocarpospora macrocephala]|uniref:Uncharacterized protein n=1 Tax=Acrocarpospora macrocephala TaxID=150177 RepID=A0A5M3WHA3_9ACTN|nr:hypothetical protein Amac_012040 [Acrocarpospora macrocephala]